ncbi:ankyrin repeat domain-containing protein 2b [Gossypium australe]|uniref:Ankyrin repeat domain-containing protein 2b n=1 Tax=Gossypium australe TaxID=47621 RepID=A0A5B6WUX2_9ROSI|nr:ankyrin repeat domain-containing protein 2b [Gossypium australe]
MGCGRNLIIIKIFRRLAPMIPKNFRIWWKRILGKTSFPSLHEVYSYVQQKESRRVVTPYNPPLEKVSLIANQDGSSGGKSNKDHLTCDYCGKPQHTKDLCWKLHGRPTRGCGGKRGGNSQPQAHLSDSMTTVD